MPASTAGRQCELPPTGFAESVEQNATKHIRKAGVATGIGGDIGWHTFRHSYRSWLDETGAPLTFQNPDDNEHLWEGHDGQ
jgi:hypothetical protein